MHWLKGSVLLALGLGLVFPAQAGKVLGDITIPRKDGNSTGFMPAAVFPHWKHRLNYTCNTCHEQLFKMKAGADPITMDDISHGKYCGVCHNGDAAFEVGFETCERCHYQPTGNP